MSCTLTQVGVGLHLRVHLGVAGAGRGARLGLRLLDRRRVGVLEHVRSDHRAREHHGRERHEHRREGDEQRPHQQERGGCLAGVDTREVVRIDPAELGHHAGHDVGFFRCRRECAKTAMGARSGVRRPASVRRARRRVSIDKALSTTSPRLPGIRCSRRRVRTGTTAFNNGEARPTSRSRTSACACRRRAPAKTDYSEAHDSHGIGVARSRALISGDAWRAPHLFSRKWTSTPEQTVTRFGIHL